MGSSGEIGRAGEAGGRVELYVMEDPECMELAVEGFWVMIKGQTNKGNVIKGVYYRPPCQDDDTNVLLFKKVRDTSKSTTLVLVGEFTCTV